MALFFSQKLWACKTCSRAHYVISHAQKWTFSWHDKSTRAQIQQPRGVHVAASERLAYSHRLTLLVQWNPACTQRASARGVLFCSRSGFLLAQLISAPSSLLTFDNLGAETKEGTDPLMIGHFHTGTSLYLDWQLSLQEARSWVKLPPKKSGNESEWVF